MCVCVVSFGREWHHFCLEGKWKMEYEKPTLLCDIGNDEAWPTDRCHHQCSAQNHTTKVNNTTGDLDKRIDINGEIVSIFIFLHALTKWMIVMTGHYAKSQWSFKLETLHWWDMLCWRPYLVQPLKSNCNNSLSILSVSKYQLAHCRLFKWPLRHSSEVRMLLHKCFYSRSHWKWNLEVTVRYCSTSCSPSTAKKEKNRAKWSNTKYYAKKTIF